MTDRRPDDLYDALRDRLANYGQEPPPPLWASIRAQLPPPVAGPQLPRRRRWSPVLLLLGLLAAGVGGSYWLWQRNAATDSFAQRTSTAHSPAVRRTQPDGPAQRGAAVDAGAPTLPSANALGNAKMRPTVGSSASAATNAGTTASATAGTRAAVAPQAGTSAAVGTYAASATPAAASFDAEASPATSVAKGQSSGGRVGSGRTSAVNLLAGRPDPRSREAAAAAVAASDAFASAQNARVARHKKPERAALAFPTDAPAQTRGRAGRLVAAAGLAAGRPGLSPTPAADDAAGAKLPEVAARNAPPPTNTPMKNPELSATTAISSGPPAAAAAIAAIGAAKIGAAKPPISPVEAPAVALRLPAFSVPAVRPQPDSAYLPKQLAQHWALVVLAGPALTHFRLGSSAADQANAQPSASSPSTPNSGPNSPTTPPGQQWPGPGFEVRAQLSRVLNGRWALGAGLGYQEYGSTVEVTKLTGSRFALPSDTLVAHRDTYRFLTVPVQAHYALGPVGKRWRYGLVAGAEAALYTGGRTLQANGSVKNWTTSNSPYRTLSLALRAGLDIRYRLSPHLEAVAQPTATYFLNPLARPDAGLAPRYLWGGSALLGLSYHLR